MNTEAVAYKKQILNPLMFSMGMLRRLPSVVFWGIRVSEIDKDVCKVTLPYSWRTQNPFKSIYFAAMAGAGELATGALCQLMLKGRPAHSMLVVDMKAEFYKKSSTKIVFTCDQGSEVSDLLDTLNNIGDSGQLTMVATGTNTHGETTGKIYVTWSFKRKE